MFCKNCGHQLNPGDKFCNSCGVNVGNESLMNNENNYNSGMINSNTTAGNKKKVSVGKTYLKIIGILIAFWFILTIITVIVNVFIASQNDGVYTRNAITNALSTLKTIITIYGIIFGWIPALIYANVKNSK